MYIRSALQKLQRLLANKAKQYKKNRVNLHVNGNTLKDM